MVLQIISHTPAWVWFLLAALLWVGAQQLFTRQVSVRRVTVFPLVMTGLSLYGTLSVFGSQAQTLPIWLTAVVLSIGLVGARPLPPSVRYDADTQRFILPGSAVPLFLILGIFCTKYAVGVSVGMEPARATQTEFAVTVSALYGVFSGVFLARAGRLWKLLLESERSRLLKA